MRLLFMALFCLFPPFVLASGPGRRGGSTAPAACRWAPWEAEAGRGSAQGLLVSLPNKAEHPRVPCTESGYKSPVTYRLFLSFSVFHLF